jgi:type II secretory pathway component PulC
MAFTFRAFNSEERSLEARPSLLRNVAENPQPLVFAVCMIVLVGFIGSELWSTTRALLNHPAATQTRNQPNSAQQYAEQIGAAELFGHAATQGNLPETTLQLTLRAVFAARDPQQASAVIETSDGRAQVLKVGATMGGVAVLQEVHENRVVLSRNGVLETLLFPAPQESTEFAIAQNTVPTSSDNPTETAPMTTPPAGASPDEIKRAAILQRLEELRARSSR